MLSSLPLVYSCSGMSTLSGAKLRKGVSGFAGSYPARGVEAEGRGKARGMRITKTRRMHSCALACARVSVCMHDPVRYFTLLDILLSSHDLLPYLAWPARCQS